MEGAGGLTPTWRQDTLNRHSKIGQLHICHHANFCKVVQSYQLLCERQQRCPMLETYGICKTMCFAKAIRWLYYPEHLPNAELNAIAKSSVSIRRKHLFKWTLRLQYCHFLYMGLFYLIFDSCLIMMALSNGNLFRVTGPFCGEFTGNRWIPHTKASKAELWYFLWSAPEQTVGLTIVTPVIWDSIALIMTSL